MSTEPADSPVIRKCAVHAEVDARSVCSRCGAFVCEACERVFEGVTTCAACVEREDNRPPSREAVVAIVFAVLVPVGLIPGLIGGVLGWRELVRIRRGQAPRSGEGYARLAVGLGALALVAALAVIVELV